MSITDLIEGVFILYSYFWWLVLLAPFQGVLRKKKPLRSDWQRAVLIAFLLWLGMAAAQFTVSQIKIASAWFWTAGAILGILMAFNWLGSIRIGSLRKIAPKCNIDWMHSLSPSEFEELVADTYRSFGHKVQVVGGKGDHGIDLIVTATNGEKRVVQCKRWRGNIGEPIVRDFAGAMQHEGASEGAIITTGAFTPQAITWVRGKPIRLYDGEEFSKIIERSQRGRTPSPSKVFEAPVEQMDQPRFCPQCGSPLVLRTAKKGDHAGNQFYGCSRYPDCRVILPLE